MSRKFKTPDYEATLHQPMSLSDALPPNHWARFVVDVIAQLDLSVIYRRYAPTGGEALAPEILLGLLFYGYATGVFSSRKLERATSDSLPFRFVAGGWHPEHDTSAHFRKTFLTEIPELFVQLLLLARAAQVLKLGTLSIDGSKSHAVSDKRLLDLEVQRRPEVSELVTLGARADHGELTLPDTWVIPDEVALRQERLVQLAEAKAVLEARAKERDAAEQAESEAKVRARDEQARTSGRQPGGRPPTPPPGPRDTDQSNFTDPDSRIMKNSTDDGFDQHYNVQAVVDQTSLLIVATALSHHPHDKREAEPDLAALPAELGTPPAAALDPGYGGLATRQALADRGIEAYGATGREPHHTRWQAWFAQAPTPPPTAARPKVNRADKLKTKIGQAIYRLRQCTVEPGIGLSKAVLGFRQFSLRGLSAAAGEWCLVCLACNLKRLHVV